MTKTSIWIQPQLTFPKGESPDKNEKDTIEIVAAGCPSGTVKWNNSYGFPFSSVLPTNKRMLFWQDLSTPTVRLRPEHTKQNNENSLIKQILQFLSFDNLIRWKLDGVLIIFQPQAFHSITIWELFYIACCWIYVN